MIDESTPSKLYQPMACCMFGNLMTAHSKAANYLKNSDLAEEIKACQANGNIVSDRLARMLMLLVSRVAAKTSWRMYSYLDDMKAEALIQLVRVNTQRRDTHDQRPNILKFDFRYSERTGLPANPFAYATQIVVNVFRRQVKMEGKIAEFRDDMLELEGALPSARRQAENDFNRSAEPIIKPKPPSRAGRKAKVEI